MSILFLGVWPLYSFFKIIPYPGLIHVQGTISLTIGSFAIGFLLTALPRFTETNHASRVTVYSLLGISFVELMVLLLGYSSYAFLFLAIKFFGIFIFAIPRFLKRKNPIPPSFIWVVFAVLYAVIGGVGTWLSPSLLFTSFLTQGFMTSLFLGIGGKLIPVLTGVSNGLIVEKKYHRYDMIFHGLLAITFFISLYFQHTLDWVRWGMSIKSMVLIVEVVFFWKLYRAPIKSSRAWLLWVATWLLPVAQVTAILFPVWNLHIEHLMFVGTFLVGTVVVASHVIVSHQGFSQDLLKKYRPLGLIGMILFFAGLTRVIAPLLTYENQLGHAGLLAVSALLYWGFIFLRPFVENKKLHNY